MTTTNETILYETSHRNGYNVNPLTRIYERASLVPAAAVIPALKVYIIIAAVKKLVVGSEPMDSVHLCVILIFWVNFVGLPARVTLNKSECSTQAFRLNVFAWNNGKGLRFLAVGFGIGLMIKRDQRGHTYRCARGEIHGPQRDVLQRKHLPRMSSLIKNESQRFEGD